MKPLTTLKIVLTAIVAFSSVPTFADSNPYSYWSTMQAERQLERQGYQQRPYEDTYSRDLGGQHCRAVVDCSSGTCETIQRCN